MTIVELLTSIANAIREKKLTTEKINAQNLAFEIKGIEPPLDTITLQQAGKYDVKEYKYAEVAPSDLEAEYTAVLEGSANEVHIPEGTTRLRKYAVFGHYKGLKVYIPTSVTSIDPSFVHFDSNLYAPSIYYAGTLSQWMEQKLGPNPSNGFYLYINDELVTEVTSVTNFKGQYIDAWNGVSALGKIRLDRVFVPNGSTVEACGLANIIAKEIIFEGTINGELANSALEGVRDATILLPTNITKIPQNCFKNVNLEELTIPEGVTTIENSAFDSGVIKSLMLPSTLTTIGATNGVSNYSTKSTIVIKATTPPTATGRPFGSSSSYTPKVIYIPAGTLTAYQTATNWSQYSSLFVEMNEITLNVQAELVNNEEYQYSVDGGQTWSVFTSETINLEEISLIKFKNANETSQLFIGKTAGAYDIGSITDAELTYATEGSMTLYIRLGETTE